MLWLLAVVVLVFVLPRVVRRGASTCRSSDK